MNDFGFTPIKEKETKLAIAATYVMDKNNLTENELRIFERISDDIMEFAENCALEFLISGLIVPEIKYATAGKIELKNLGIKKYENLVLPQEMWVRDSA